MGAFLSVLQAKVAVLADRLTFGGQIAISSAVLSFLAVATVAGSAAWTGRQQAIDLVGATITARAATIADRLDRSIYNRFHEVGVFANLAPLRPVWTGDAAVIREVLNQLLASYGDYAWLGFASPDGRVIAATRGAREGATVAHEPWFVHGLNGPTIDDLHETLLSRALESNPTGEPLRFVDIAFPVRDASGKTIGVLGAHLGWAWASRLRDSIVTAADVTDGSEIWVISGSGHVLLGPNGLGSDVPAPLSPSELATIRQERTGLLAQPQSSAPTLLGFAGTRGYRQAPGFDWVVLARQPLAAAYQLANSFALSILIIGAAAAVAASAVGVLLARRVSRPIQRLTAEADMVGRDPDARLTRQAGSREVLQLSSALRSLLRRVGVAEEVAAQAKRQAMDKARRLEHDLSELKRLADTDELSGLLNRRAFNSFGEDAMNHVRRHRRGLAVLVADLDHFKRINDTYGHAAGDEVIRRVAQILTEEARVTDKVARLGGEEFVVLMRETDDKGVERLGERIRRRIEREHVASGGWTIRVSASFGAAIATPDDRDIDEVIERADRALYEAKAGGRNRVVVAPAAKMPAATPAKVPA